MKSFFRLILATVLVLVAVAANAEDYTLAVGENTLKGHVSCNAVFTAAQDCKVLVEAQETFSVSYQDKDIAYQYVPGAGFSYSYEIDGVKAGESVNVKSDFVWNTVSIIKVTVHNDGAAIPVEVRNYSPTPGTVFSWNTTGLVTLNFNKAVSLSKVTVVAGEYEEMVDDVHLGSSLGCNITNALNKLLAEGKLIPGEKFQVKITGLCDAADKNNKYGEDGTMLIEYIAPYQQHNFVKATVGGVQLSYTEANTYKFLSYYPLDSEDGVFVFEFDADVDAVNKVTLSMGNIDLDAQGKYHRSDLPYTIEGNKIIVDARGTLRSIATLFPFMQNDEEGGEGAEGDVASMLGSFDTSHLTVTLSNVVDKNGNVFLTVNQGSVGSFSFVMAYEEIIDEAYIDGDNKADGDEVASGENVRLWLSNADIKFDGIEVTYFVPSDNPDDELETANESRQVIVKEYTTEPDPYGIIIVFDMPDISDAVPGTTVRVALNNANSSDGMPHYLYIEFKAVDPTDAIANIAAGTAKAAGIYTLSGVKVNSTEAGRLYIVNGKKVMK